MIVTGGSKDGGDTVEGTGVVVEVDGAEEVDVVKTVELVVLVLVLVLGVGAVVVGAGAVVLVEVLDVVVEAGHVVVVVAFTVVVVGACVVVVGRTVVVVGLCVVVVVTGAQFVFDLFVANAGAEVAARMNPATIMRTASFLI